MLPEISALTNIPEAKIQEYLLTNVPVCAEQPFPSVPSEVSAIIASLAPEANKMIKYSNALQIIMEAFETVYMKRAKLTTPDYI